MPQDTPAPKPSTKLMYIESKAGGLAGPARIGRVTMSKTGATIYYKGQSFQTVKGTSFKAHYRDSATGDDYWITTPRQDGADRAHKSHLPVEIDEDAREEYWVEIRKLPAKKLQSKA